jgi:hypothetical protein
MARHVGLLEIMNLKKGIERAHLAWPSAHQRPQPRRISKRELKVPIIRPSMAPDARVQNLKKRIESLNLDVHLFGLTVRISKRELKGNSGMTR